MSIIRWVCATRTKFSHFLGSTLCLRRDGPPTALFPLPLPVIEPIAGCLDSVSRDLSYEAAITRVLHVVICALNYVYFSPASAPFDLLKRQPGYATVEAAHQGM
jgi:hypothetical protein